MDNFSLNDKIKMMFDYYLAKCKELEDNSISSPQGVSYDNYFTAKNTGRLLFGFAVDIQGMNGLPQILSDEEWEQTQGDMYFHGFAEYEYGAEFLSNFVYHYGDGSLMLKGDVNGFYVTNKAGRALRFTNKDLDENNVDFYKVLPVKINKGKKANMSEIYEDCMFFYTGIVNETSKEDNLKNLSEQYKANFAELWDALENIRLTADRKDFSSYVNSFLLNPTTIAVLFGIEWVEDTKYSSFLLPTDFICLNRANIIIPESHAKRFFENSVHYKNGYFDFNPEGEGSK